MATKYRITSEEVASLLALLRERAEFVEITEAVTLCRDPDDDIIVETALNGRADAIVSRDDDLKGAPDLVAVLGQNGIAVLSVRRFLGGLP